MFYVPREGDVDDFCLGLIKYNHICLCCVFNVSARENRQEIEQPQRCISGVAEYVTDTVLPQWVLQYQNPYIAVRLFY